MTNEKCVFIYCFIKKRTVIDVIEELTYQAKIVPQNLTWFFLSYATPVLRTILYFFLDKKMSNRPNRFKKRLEGNSTTAGKLPRNPPKVTWKHSWNSDEVKGALTQSDFRTLPTEVMLHVFKFLTVHDLGNVSLVCRSFKMIADQDEIWKLKSNCKFIHFFLFLY
jgi:hypothetical protein